jgi:zinc-ribbon domain
MFCPKCATQNVDNARFCRACGSDISLVPAALTGRIPQAPAVIEDEDELRSHRRSRRRRKKEPTYEKAFENLGVGLAFLIISTVIALFVPSGRFWWFWLLIPTFACLGEGLGQLIRLRRELSPATMSDSTPELSSSGTAGELPPPVRGTSEIMAPPPSVTEGTTRHLGTEAPNK